MTQSEYTLALATSICNAKITTYQMIDPLVDILNAPRFPDVIARKKLGHVMPT
jgi:hypothetical protein